MKIIFFNYFIIIFYLISSSVSYSIERPEIKNLIVHKDKKKIENIEFIKSDGQKVSLNNYKSNPLIINFWASSFALFINNSSLSVQLVKINVEIKIRMIFDSFILVVLLFKELTNLICSVQIISLRKSR